MVALMGASGSGKTTLMNILGCLDRPTSGRYWFDGQEVSTCSRDDRARLRNRKIGFVFQSFNLLPRTSALENVLLPLECDTARLDQRDAVVRARALLERVGLGDRLDHEPSQLSGGQQQRVAIARALINQPAAAPRRRADRQPRLADQRRDPGAVPASSTQEGLTIILVTHDADVARHAERVIRIHDGRIAEDHGPDAVALSRRVRCRRCRGPRPARIRTSRRRADGFAARCDGRCARCGATCCARR